MEFGVLFILTTLTVCGVISSSAERLDALFPEQPLDEESANANCTTNEFEKPVGIEYEAFREGLSNKSLTVIELRNLTELQISGMIPGTFHLPLHELDDAFKLLDEDQFFAKYHFKKPTPGRSENVVFTCRTGRRALLAWQMLKPFGYCEIRIYYGSFRDWKAKGGDIIYPDHDHPEAPSNQSRSNQKITEGALRLIETLVLFITIMLNMNTEILLHQG